MQFVNPCVCFFKHLPGRRVEEGLWVRMLVFQYPSSHTCLHSLRTCASRGTTGALQPFPSHPGYPAKHIFCCGMNGSPKENKTPPNPCAIPHNPAPKMSGQAPLPLSREMDKAPFPACGKSTLGGIIANWDITEVAVLRRVGAHRFYHGSLGNSSCHLSTQLKE